ncbi:hypothetical protein C173_23587 [Paenibacillus sp. FSL R7-277]|uniref:hypothetical protein n=1 Tax=Paenibacillus sp. FSL R7-277 TaxID=1227352 RepID=UPI0003E28F54|nr:hypothetical protein [Paenibacillus sp. FSL R7-277]ETT63331.1 hypothetical protein C173_23587 [Paenibacillus sp. FSL R7-277]
MTAISITCLELIISRLDLIIARLDLIASSPPSPQAGWLYNQYKRHSQREDTKKYLPALYLGLRLI